ncbi:MAG: hypothetical protein WBD48_04065, partial [Pseudolabrys sp.]
IQFPEESTILPIDPMFRSDDDFLPLQAADMFAWCIRNATDKQDETAFNWLLDEMPNVRGTEYSQYYDLERMQAVMNDSIGIVKKQGVTPELTELYIQTRKLMKRR